MKTLVSALTAIFLLLGMLAFAGKSSTDFSGTWVLDKSKSDLGIRGARRSPDEGFPGGGGRAGGVPGGGRRGGGFPGGRSGTGRTFPGGGRSDGNSPDQTGRGGGAPADKDQARDMDFTLTISQAKNELTLTQTFHRGGKIQDVEQKFALDGQENTNPALMGRGEIKSRATWHKETLVIEGAQDLSTPRGDFQVAFKEELSLSKDGKVLTIRTTRSTAMGENSSKQVFNRQ